MVKGGESVKGPRLCVVALWHGVTWCNLKSCCYVAGGFIESLLRKTYTFYPKNKITACKGELNVHL